MMESQVLVDIRGCHLTGRNRTNDSRRAGHTIAAHEDTGDLSLQTVIHRLQYAALYAETEFLKMGGLDALTDRCDHHVARNTDPDRLDALPERGRPCASIAPTICG